MATGKKERVSFSNWRQADEKAYFRISLGCKGFRDGAQELPSDEVKRLIKWFCSNKHGHQLTPVQVLCPVLNARNSPISNQAASKRPLVSINIPTFNSEKTLGECLRSAKEQSYANVEILVIDSYSRDATLDIAREYEARTYSAPSLSEARRLGVERSLGKYILFLDSDQVLSRDAIAKCVEKCETEGWDALTLFERSIIEKNTFTQRVIAYDKWLFHTEQDDDPLYGSAIPRFFRSNVFLGIKWPSRLGVQEHNLIYYEIARTGAKVAFVDAFLYHHEPYSLAQFARKFYRYGFHYVSALRQNGRFVLLHSMPRRTYLSKRALSRPSLFMGLMLLYYVKALATFIGAVAGLSMQTRRHTAR